MTATSQADIRAAAPLRRSWAGGVLRLLAILAVIALAWGLRFDAAQRLPIDFDEDDYLRAGQEYAILMRTGNWGGFLETNYRPEHPPLAKILIGISLLSAPEQPLAPDAMTTAGPNSSLPSDLVQPARLGMAFLGTLSVGLLALVSPLAALMLSIHPFTIKYVSQIMLEALPALTSLACVLAYLRWKKRGRGASAWLVASAILLGLTAASKYLYCVVALAILVDGLLLAIAQRQGARYVKLALVWGLIAVAVFLVFDPYLWPDPLSRLRESVFFHAGYATGVDVQNAGFPFWKPFHWLFYSPHWWHPEVFLFPTDIVITSLAILGLWRLWRKERLYVLWLGIALLFLLVWPTKWPQYIIILTSPLCMAAAEGLRLAWDVLSGLWKGRRMRVEQIPAK